ncbi:MAG: helix-turn-helix domain-containing protein [Kofleriaceae bacterium]
MRELRNVIERAALLAGGGEILAEHILLDPTTPRAATPGADELTAAQLAERERIIAALDACAGNQGQAAKELGISRANLVNKLALYKVPRPRDKKR